MTPFIRLESVAAPLLRDNIDTDLIIRVEPLFSGVPRADLGRYCFETLRYRQDGTEDPDFVFNQPASRHAQILLAGANFGCGSSREGAVWALLAMGVRCVIAPSFGDIFFNNCFQNGLLPVRLARADVEALAEHARTAPAARMVVDLQHGFVAGADGRQVGFEISARRREALLEGLDPIAQTLKHQARIDDFQRQDALRRPWIYRFGALADPIPAETGQRPSPPKEPT
ncbi:3-isopropylmalate dehydratase small subunit [Pigmentiphaga sp. NML080357]|uniref:3-isopropylmalate dehydratase small subunit n=1 Tax=Pigmentiphaga sp. NML080357 TaxID=2008675 RepID=UPI000B409D4A|nr:3-isopropylmalate dehydratase small subunit [Pigmentiphaga sp. NML080357]OVZ64729.1 3-isopropylmalate dehydratase small subunit [Pigmentiphaga sp. NML080357]